MPHGKLTVAVEGAADIKIPGVYGRGGTYCTLACGSQVSSSLTVEGGGSRPLFNTAFEFEIDRTTNDLHVCVYSKGSPRDDEIIGYCTLNFKKVFYHGHTVPLTAYPIQQPSGDPGGRINMSFKFKMRPSPNGTNAHVPVRCSPPRRATSYKIVAQQSLPLDWGHDLYEEGASEAQKYTVTKPEPHRHPEKYVNLPGTAADNYHDPKLSFIRYGDSATPCPESPRTPSHAQPCPARTPYNPPYPGKPQPPVIVQPQVQRPSALVHFAGAAFNGLAEGAGGEVANQLLGGLGQSLCEAVLNF